MYMDTVPMQWAPSQDSKCSGYTLPVVDGAITAYFIGVGTATIVSPDYMGSPRDFMLALGVAWLIPGILFAASAVTGFTWAAECNEACDTHDEWRGMEPAEKETFEYIWRTSRGATTSGVDP